MIFFKSKKAKEIENLLKASKQDFGFDSESVKHRILLAANVRHLTKDDVRRLTWSPSTWPKYAFGTALALVLAVTTSGFAVASNSAAPGDVLFPVQKLQTKIVLSLPLPE